MSTDLLFTPAVKAAALIRARKLSPVEYLDTVLKAAEKANPKLNCFRVVMAEEARRDAKRAEDAVMRGDALGPLHGVPVSIKDLVDVKDVPTRHGSTIFADNPPAVADDILVKRLRARRRHRVRQILDPEFGVKGLTDGPSFGITRNPWNLERTPGGSSGGAAAAVAAGLGPIALGTDGAGSVRGPASCAGLVGHKPTLGAVPYDTTRDAFGNNVYAGPLSRTITDAAVMHSVLVGPSNKDPWTLAGAIQHPVSPRLSGEDLSGVRIGYIELCANPRVAADVRANTRTCLAAWTAIGAEVEEVTEKIDWIEYEGRVLYQANFAVFCAQYLPKWQNQMDPVTLAFMQRGEKFSLADFRNAQFARGALFRRIQTLFERYDFIVTPTSSRTALDVTHDAANDEVIVDGVKCGITRQGWTSYQYPFNLTGHPALAVPSGFGTDAMPTSVQIVGKWRRDADVLRLGALLERARPWADNGQPICKSRGTNVHKTVLAGLLMALALANPAAAEFPDRPIRIVVPYAPGGNTDVTARLVSDRLKDVMGVAVLVENKPGASGMIGMDAVARSAPDGYTLLVSANSMVSVPAIYGNAPYDWKTAFQPISHIQSVPAVVVVPADSPIRTMADFIKVGRDTPAR